MLMISIKKYRNFKTSASISWHRCVGEERLHKKTTRNFSALSKRNASTKMLPTFEKYYLCLSLKIWYILKLSTIRNNRYFAFFEMYQTVADFFNLNIHRSGHLYPPRFPLFSCTNSSLKTTPAPRPGGPRAAGRETRGIRIPAHSQMACQLWLSAPVFLNACECLTGSWLSSTTVDLLSHSTVWNALMRVKKHFGNLK